MLTGPITRTNAHPYRSRVSVSRGGGRLRPGADKQSERDPSNSVDGEYRHVNEGLLPTEEIACQHADPKSARERDRPSGTGTAPAPLRRGAPIQGANEEQQRDGEHRGPAYHHGPSQSENQLVATRGDRRPPSPSSQTPPGLAESEVADTGRIAPCLCRGKAPRWGHRYPRWRTPAPAAVSPRFSFRTASPGRK